MCPGRRPRRAARSQTPSRSTGSDRTTMRTRTVRRWTFAPAPRPRPRLRVERWRQGPCCRWHRRSVPRWCPTAPPVEMPAARREGQPSSTSQHILGDRGAAQTRELEQLLDAVLELFIRGGFDRIVERRLPHLVVLAADLLIEPRIGTGDGRTGEKRIEIEIADLLHRHRAIQDRKSVV